MTTKTIEQLAEENINLDDLAVQKAITVIFRETLEYDKSKDSIFDSFFDKKFFDAEGFLDLGMPFGGALSIVLLNDVEILEDKSEFRGWDQTAIQNFDEGFSSRALPLLKEKFIK